MRSAARTYERIHAALVLAQKERDVLQDFDGKELLWMAYERLCVMIEANRIRQARGQTLIPLERILRAESLASGHVDYTKKFAMYVADDVEAE